VERRLAPPLIRVFYGPTGELEQSMLKYIELKSGFSDNGPAWIARVKLSHSRRTVYFGGKALKRGRGVAGNHYDLLTGDEYWISGVKKAGSNRHSAGSGVISIEASAVAEYLELTGMTHLEPSRFLVVPDLPEPDPSSFASAENRKLHQ
jgi:hypothetical protein